MIVIIALILLSLLFLLTLLRYIFPNLQERPVIQSVVPLGTTISIRRSSGTYYTKKLLKWPSKQLMGLPCYMVRNHKDKLYSLYNNDNSCVITLADNHNDSYLIAGTILQYLK